MLNWLLTCFAAERLRWALWVPVVFAIGAGSYFALTVEPAWWLAPAIALAAGFVGVVGRQIQSLIIVCVIAFIAAAGFGLSQARTASLKHVILDRTIGPTSVSGRIATYESFPDGARITIDHVRVTGLEPPVTPERVRIRLRGKQDELSPGTWVSLRARLAPPPPPAMPGAYDFQFLSYFDEIGGTGFAIGKPRVTAEAGETLTLVDRWKRFRQSVTDRIRQALGGATGAVSAALITGDESAIPQSLMDAYRDSGIAHLLSISGLHIGLVAGLVFAVVRMLLALFPSVALRYPIKKWAAIAAFLATVFYTFLAGATVPTQRSFVMMGLVLLAVVFDRQGLSMRFVAVAALAILGLEPEALLNASFQMSFAAVIALIAVYETWSRWLIGRRDSGLLYRAWIYVFGVTVTTLVASAATAPFVVYHFNRITILGLVGNFVAIPLSSVLVMPAAIVAMVLMPFGLEQAGLVPMGWGVDIINAWAKFIAGFDSASMTAPAMPGTALVAFVLGGAWLCLWRRSWRRLGVVGLAAGLVLAMSNRGPDVLADGEGRLFAIATEDGRFLVSSAVASRFERGVWMRRVGFETEQTESWNKSRDMHCDALGCVGTVRGETVNFATDRAALADDCTPGAIVISAVPVPRRACAPAKLVIDRFDLWRKGTHALWIGAEGVRIETVNGFRGDRPWVVRPGGTQPRLIESDPAVGADEVD
jgi:competence protein ComEC